MEKKSLITVSLCAVIFLILGSLSNVVGYQSVKSTTVSDSPLFQTRTQRATNQQQNSITSLYIGMGKENSVQFPIKDNKTEQLNKAMELVSKMDDKTFSRFTEMCILRIKSDNSLKDVTSFDIVKVLYLLKTKPDMIMTSSTNRNNQGFTDTQVYTACVGPTICVVRAILVLLFLMIALTIGVLAVIFEVFAIFLGIPTFDLCS